MKRWTEAAALIGLLAGCAALLWPVLPAPFYFDDYSHVIFNRAIRYWDNWRVFFETGHQRVRLVTNWSLALSYSWKGLWEPAFRGVNVALHLANGALLAGLAWRLRPGKRNLGLALAALFLFHPIALETAAYISGRSSIMVLFFWLCALHAALRIDRSRIWWCGVLASGILAIFSKEHGVVLPVLLLGFFLVKRWRVRWGLIFPLLPIGLWLLWRKADYVQGMWAGFLPLQGDVVTVDAAGYLRFLAVLWKDSLRLLLALKASSIDHGIALEDYRWWLPVAETALLAAAVVLAWRSYRNRDALFAFGLIWFLAALSPTHSFVPVMDPLSERNFYGALPGFFLMFWSAWDRWLPLRAQWLLLTALVVPAWLVGGKRMAEWRDPVLLWSSAAREAPGKMRPLYNATVSLRHLGRDAEAFRMLAEGIRDRDPGAENQEELRSILSTLAQAGWDGSGGSWKKFREEFLPLLPAGPWRHFVHLTAALPAAHGDEFDRAWREGIPVAASAKDPLWSEHLRSILKARQRLETGRPRETVNLLQAVLSRFPEELSPYWHDWYTLSRAWRALGRQEEEVKYLQRFADRSWFFKQIPVLPLRRLGELRESRGEWQAAADCWGSLIRSNIDDAKLRQRYAEALRRANLRGGDAQLSQAEYFSRRGIPRNDPRELVRR